jgi:hypothetical protein
MKSLAIFSCALLFWQHGMAQSGTNDLLLKDYHPVSIYHVPATTVPKAAWPVTDPHSHDYANSDAG